MSPVVGDLIERIRIKFRVDVFVSLLRYVANNLLNLYSVFVENINAGQDIPMPAKFVEALTDKFPAYATLMDDFSAFLDDNPKVCSVRLTN